MLTERFGKTRSVFGGAVRAYLRGFAEDANAFGLPGSPSRHRSIQEKVLMPISETA
jgi:hypothetical protein